jgi:hypothetical protein
MEDGVDENARWLLLMLVSAIILGLVVLWVRDDYRFESIVESNRNFFPALEVDPP